MRQLSCAIAALCFTLLFFNTLKAQNTGNTTTSAISVLNGGWRSIAFIINGKTDSSGADFRVYHDGFFSIVGKDSTGAWKETHAGTYDISGNLYKEHIMYSSYSDHIGMIHWQEFTIKGDTITFKLFNKVLTRQGHDIAATLPKMEIVCVRMKQ